MRIIVTIICLATSLNLFGQVNPFSDTTKYFTNYNVTGRWGSHFRIYAFDEPKVWYNFKTHYEDSTIHFVPVLEEIPKSEVRKIKKNLFSLMDMSDSTEIVPWHTVLGMPYTLRICTFPDTYDPKRMIDRCDSCNNRLLISEINLPYDLKFNKINLGERNYEDSFLVYCGHCGVQYRVIKRSSLYLTSNISHIPQSMVGFWEFRYGYNPFNTRHPGRTIMEISEEGLVRMWHEELLWHDYDFVPQCMWINSTLSQSSLRYITFDKGHAHTFIGNKIESYSIKRGFGKLVMKKNLNVLCRKGSVQISRPLLFDRKYKFKKIDYPYSVFPNVSIGKFPDHHSFQDPVFWNRITDAIVLTELEDNSISINTLDSLGIDVHVIKVSNDDSSINIDGLLEVLDLIHICENNDSQILILCNSKGHYLSKLIGECYHYQKSGKILDDSPRKLLDGSWIRNSILINQCENNALPPWEEMKKMLRTHAK